MEWEPRTASHAHRVQSVMDREGEGEAESQHAPTACIPQEGGGEGKP